MDWHGELGGVVVMPTLTQPALAVDIVHAIGHDLAEFLVLEVVHVHAPADRPSGRQSVPPFLKLPISSFFFVSTEMTGWPAAWAAITLRVDVLELRIAIGMARALVGLAVDLARVAELAPAACARCSG